MQIILRNEEQWRNLIDDIRPYNSPDSYPCLAVGSWYNNVNGPDGYIYQYVYLIDESPDDINQDEKFTLDLKKL